MTYDRRLRVMGVALGSALLAFVLYFALRISAAPNQLTAEAPPDLSAWNPDEASDEDLVNAFFRSVGAGDGQPDWRLRKWVAPVGIKRVPKPADPRLMEDHVPRALASVLFDIGRAAPGLVNVIDKIPACPAGEHVVLLDASIWEIGIARELDIFYTPPADDDAKCYRYADGDVEQRPLMLTHASTTKLRVHGDEITGAMIGIGYSWTVQYHQYDLAVDVLRKEGLTPSAIASALPILTDEQILENAQSQPMVDNPTAQQESEQKLASQDPADRVVREHEHGFSADWLNSCYSRDFDDHAYSVMASALSQSLGVDWRARTDPADLATGGNSRRPNVELVRQSYRGPDYWLLRRYWPLFVSVLYDSKVKAGMNAKELRPIVAKLIASRRNGAAYRANINRQECTNLPRF